MRRPIAASICLLLLAAGRAGASCGSASCPIDLTSHEQPSSGLLTLDASFQYINQDQPRAGLHKAAVGEVRNPEHNEVATINRIWNFRGDYDFNDRWGLGILLPLISRSHDHIAVDTGQNERWSFTGAGDLVVQARFAALPKEAPADIGVTLIGGVKFPTGRTGAHNSDETAEVTLQPGTGSYDLFAGLTVAKNVARAPMLTGETAWVPAFASFTYKQNNPGADRYRMGDEALANAGGSYGVLRSLDVLGQLNLRVKMRDYNGGTIEDTSFTGGNFLYISPGLRYRLTDALSAYGYVQLPVYQRVNQEQLTAKQHWLFGLTWRLGGV